MQRDAVARKRLVAEIRSLANRALFGTASETFRTCGNPGCRCHDGGPKHGPHLYMHFRKPDGKTGGYYVPVAFKEKVYEGIAAWNALQECLKKLSELNSQRIKNRNSPRPRASKKTALRHRM